MSVNWERSSSVRGSEHFFFKHSFFFFFASVVAQLVKNPPAMQETPVRFLGQENPL